MPQRRQPRDWENYRKMENVDTSTSVLSLCSGGAGLELALRLVVPSIRTICYVEREVFACSVLATRMAEKTLPEATIWSDIKTFDGSKWSGLVDVLAAGFPCTPFSVAGKKLGEKDPRHLWPDVARIVRECNPPFIFLENVPNLLNLGYRQVRKDLRTMGYEVEAGIFSAAEIGATHIRKRIFILAAREGILSLGEDDVADSCCKRRQQESRSTPGDEKENERGKEQRMYKPECSFQNMEATTNMANPQSGMLQPDNLKDVADAFCPRFGRREQRGPDSKRGEVGQFQDRESIANQPGNRNNVLEKTDGVGSLDDKQSPEGRASKSTPQSGGDMELIASPIPLFPPGPTSKEWAKISTTFPALEPSICNVADGLAFGVGDAYIGHRQDQLRLLGNGVQPACAAFAFVVLLDKLFGSRNLGGTIPAEKNKREEATRIGNTMGVVIWK